MNASENGSGAHGRWKFGLEHAVIAYVILAVGALIVLRAVVDELDFISVGWILVLAALPLLPWLLPRLGDFLKAISPYVESLKLGALQLDLRGVRSEAISVPSRGILASVPNDVAALSSGTAIQELASAFRDFRRRGAGPVVVIDLQDGRKWRLPNLYFLTRLLELEPTISQLLFTEARGGVDGYVVGTCHPDEFRRQVEVDVPSYEDASSALDTTVERDLDDVVQAQELGTSYTAFLGALPPSPRSRGRPPSRLGDCRPCPDDPRGPAQHGCRRARRGEVGRGQRSGGGQLRAPLRAGDGRWTTFRFGRSRGGRAGRRPGRARSGIGERLSAHLARPWDREASDID